MWPGLSLQPLRWETILALSLIHILSINLGDTVRYSQNGLSTVSSWQVDNKINYAFDGGVDIAGAAVQWLRDKLRIIWNSAETENIASSVQDTGGLYFVPAFSGLAAPHWDQYARGMMIGITGGTSREHIVRAVLESIAFQVYDNAQVMEQDSGYEKIVGSKIAYIKTFNFTRENYSEVLKQYRQND